MAIQDQINRITNEVGTQSEIIANIKDTLSDLDDGLTAMSEEVSELVDMPEEVNLTTMTEGVAAANGEIVVQSELIEQIKDALQGKAVPGGEEITPGFTSEKYKKWLEINGYTIVNFTLTSQATANFNINHPLGRPAKSIICFRADLDGSVVNDKICFAISAEGSTADNLSNRLIRYISVYMPFCLAIKLDTNDYRAILENTAEHIQLRYVSGQPSLVWASGDYYLAVL